MIRNIYNLYYVQTIKSQITCYYNNITQLRLAYAMAVVVCFVFVTTYPSKAAEGALHVDNTPD